MDDQLLECVPNFSEGRDPNKVQAIVAAIAEIGAVKVLHVDMGHDANRTVVTFAGEPEAVVEAAFRGIRRATELIDMRVQRGEHPRLGATDVCPLVPLGGLDLEQSADWARRLGQRVGEELQLPVYLYEAAAGRSERRNLATIRAGEYEGLVLKMQDPDWRPDYGPTTPHPSAGAVVVGARRLLVAYNVNLDTESVAVAKRIAAQVRESGGVIKKADGSLQRLAGLCPGVKAIGWYMAEYGRAQVSMNLTNLEATPLHLAFEACREVAARFGARVTGSELVGLLPLSALVEAGAYFLAKAGRPLEKDTATLISVAVDALGLAEVGAFEPERRVIEYLLREPNEG